MKWAIWVPWLKDFFRRGADNQVLLFSSQAVAKTWCDDANYHGINGMRVQSNAGGLYRAVPWDEQAQAIASGKVLP